MQFFALLSYFFTLNLTQDIKRCYEICCVDATTSASHGCYTGSARSM